jgi:hypothetical protein
VIKEKVKMTERWMPMHYGKSGGYIAEFIILVQLKRGSSIPTEEEMRRAVMQCLKLERGYPLPQNYLIN